MDRKYFLCAVTISAAVVAVALYLPGCGDGEHAAACVTPLEFERSVMEAVEQLTVETADNAEAEKVYFTDDISADGIMAVYTALGLTPDAGDNVAVKVHTGEPGPTYKQASYNPAARYFVKPALMKKLVDHVEGTFIETNTVYPGSHRDATDKHLEVAEVHGFTAVAPVVILDENVRDTFSIPIANGKRLSNNIVGGRLDEFDFHIVISHFKGHASGGFGGALKNLSIGYASKPGKAWIHTGGRSRTNFSDPQSTQDDFIRSMADAAKTIVDRAQGKMLYISVMNNISTDCDCWTSPAVPKIADIGILASLDPVALDRACLDLVDKAPNNADLLARISAQQGRNVVKYAVELGIGDTVYQLIDLKTSIKEPTRELPSGLGQIRVDL